MLKHKVNRLLTFPGYNMPSGGGSSSTSKAEIPAEAKPYVYGDSATAGILPEASNIYQTQKALGPYQDQQLAMMNPVQDYGYQRQSQVGDQMVNAGMAGMDAVGKMGMNYLGGGAGGGISAGGGSGQSYKGGYKSNVDSILGMDYRNPYLEETVRNAQDSASQAFNRNVMPSLRGNAIGAGQYGSSRDAIAQGLAGGDFGKYLGDLTSQAYSNAYNQNYNAMTGLTGQLSGQDSAEAMSKRNSAVADAASQRGYDANMRQLGLSAMNSMGGMGNMGLLGAQGITSAGQPYQLQNQQIYDLGLNNEKAYRGFEQGLLNNYAGTVIPGAGMGQTQTQQNNPGALGTIGTLGQLGLMAMMIP